MRNITLLLGEFLWGSPYRLDILTKILKIIFNQNLLSVSSVCSVCSVDFLSSEFKRIFFFGFFARFNIQATTG